jgi:phosphopantothenoylcysteine decarboxylase/phosphopantothenate--cysteine ligase
MAAATLARADDADVIVATAAVADYRPATVHAHKLKKGGEAVEPLALERTVDILATIGERNAARERPAFLVGFAAETEHLEEHARAKLVAKRLDAIAVNDVGTAGSGFGTGDNALVLLWPPDGRRDLGSGTKADLAGRLWDAISAMRAKRAQ